RHDNRAWLGEPDPRGRGDRGFDRNLFGADISGGLIGKQRHELIGEVSKHRGAGMYIAQHSEFVGNQGMVYDVKAHGFNLARSPYVYARDVEKFSDEVAMRLALEQARLALPD